MHVATVYTHKGIVQMGLLYSRKFSLISQIFDTIKFSQIKLK